MAGIAVADKSLVMAAAGAQAGAPSRSWQSYLVSILPRLRKSFCFSWSMPVATLPENVLVGIDEAVAGSDIARRADAHQAQTRAAGVRFVDALVQLGEGVADIGKAVVLAAQSIFEILVGQHRWNCASTLSMPGSLIE